jgi:ATP-dependent helicase Lhr and Lhr-like helicase
MTLTLAHLEDAPMVSFHPAVRGWFSSAFAAPTAAQRGAWPSIAKGSHTLVVAPTGTGKTLSAFLACIDRVMRAPPPPKLQRCRVLYVSPLKALAVDVEKNLRQPIAGIAAWAETHGESLSVPRVAVRTGDTDSAERQRQLREPSDFLITTPESLYLLLTSKARAMLASVETVIIDEIHALVPSKRGAHLSLSLARLDALVGRSVQRVGLSATQRPFEEVARFLTGHHPLPACSAHDVTLVDARGDKALEVRVTYAPPNHDGSAQQSTWERMAPRLLQCMEGHRSTLVFVNSRRAAERLATAINDVAGEVVAFAHHGSLARPARLQLEDKLKQGLIRMLVCTSSLELGIDIGTIDLVVQVDAPPTVASALQRMGRAGHQVGALTKGVLMAKSKPDLLHCAATARAILDRDVESTHTPQNALDVLAQQIVAMVAMDDWHVEDLFRVVRCAAGYAQLPRALFDGVLDMLSGAYAHDARMQCKARITWDRTLHTLHARVGAQRAAIMNAGTIPDRGLYGVFLAHQAPGAKHGRVGELDEEMVFELAVGETFLLGASTWRVDTIDHDRVMVTPAPAQPGKLPFWRGEQQHRPVEYGRIVGQMTRTIHEQPRSAAMAMLHQLGLDDEAAGELVGLVQQQGAQGVVPDDRTIVIERGRDELGDVRVCLLSPLGGAILAPLALAVAAKARRDFELSLQINWTNDGLIMRAPEHAHLDLHQLLPDATEVEDLVMAHMGESAAFAGRFREAANRALLMTKRNPRTRAPLWQQRKRSQDLLAAASSYPQFPLLLEAHREVLRDVFDVSALVETLHAVERGEMKVAVVESDLASPFASSLLYAYVANNVYDADGGAEGQAQALHIDHAQLAMLLGDEQLRDLLDANIVNDVEDELQCKRNHQARHADDVHDMLSRLGPLGEDDIRIRHRGPDALADVRQLHEARRIVSVVLGGRTLWAAVEDEWRVQHVHTDQDALRDMLARLLRTHVVVKPDDVAKAWGVDGDDVNKAMQQLVGSHQAMRGAFLPGGSGVEYADPDVLRMVRRRTLHKLRNDAIAVPARQLALFAAKSHRQAPSMDGLLDAIERLQGTPLLASDLEQQIFPARVPDYRPDMLDTLLAAGEVMWCGVEPVGNHDGRIMLFLTDAFERLRRPPARTDLTTLQQRIVLALQEHGALGFESLQRSLQTFAPTLLGELWSLLWMGHIMNDSMRGLRRWMADDAAARGRPGRPGGFRSRRTLSVPGSEGRFMITPPLDASLSDAARALAVAQQMLLRHGVVTKAVVQAEGIEGGFTGVYDVLRTLEDRGKIRRGYFVDDVGGLQFATSASIESLRACQVDQANPHVLWLAATDPANLYGVSLPWPAHDLGAPMRAAGASVLLVDGVLRAYVSKNGQRVWTYLDGRETEVAAHVAHAFADLVQRRRRHGDGLALLELHASTALDEALRSAGFVHNAGSYVWRSHIATR